MLSNTARVRQTDCRFVSSGTNETFNFYDEFCMTSKQYISHLSKGTTKQLFTRRNAAVMLGIYTGYFLSGAQLQTVCIHQ